MISLPVQAENRDSDGRIPDRFTSVPFFSGIDHDCDIKTGEHIVVQSDDIPACKVDRTLEGIL